jgi:hypothetical protein
MLEKVLLAAGVLALSVSPGPWPDGTNSDEAVAAEAPALEADARLVAELLGIDEDAAVEEAKLQDAFIDSQWTVFERYPQAVTDHRWEGDHGVVWVLPGFQKPVGSLPDEDLVAIQTSETGTVPMVDRSTVELLAIERLQEAGLEDVGARYDPHAAAVVATVFDMELMGAIESQSLETDSFVIASTDYPPMEILLEFSDEPVPVAESTTRGGMAYGGCTGGFVGYRDGYDGIVTAAHCSTKPSTYDGDSTGSTYTASGSRDLRFTRPSGGTPDNRFRYAWGKYKDVTSLGIVSPGITLCHFGTATGNACSKVATYEGCATYSSGQTWCGLWMTQTNVSQGGDSGGPWYYGSRAYGIHSGGASGSILTPIAEVYRLGGSASVKTS